MPRCYIAAEVEPLEMDFWAIFDVKKLMIAEAERRAWEYLEQIGYKPHKTARMSVSLVERSSVQLVRIEAQFEQNWNNEHLEIEVPITQFNALVPPLRTA